MLGHGRPPTANLLKLACALALCGLLCAAAILGPMSAHLAADEPTGSASPIPTTMPNTMPVVAPEILQTGGTLPQPTAPAGRPPFQPAVAPAAKPQVSMRLRIEWGGGTARRYSGKIEVVGGKVVGNHTSLGLDVDEPGSMYVEDGALQIEPRAPRVYDGVDIGVQGPADGKLVIAFQSSTGIEPAPAPIEVPLAAVLHETFHAPLNDPGANRVSVRRKPGDRLRVHYNSPSLIYRPGELMQIELAPHLLGLAPATELRLTASLQTARQSKSLWSDSTDLAAPLDDGNWNRIPLSLRLPDTEGVYDVVFELQQRNITTRLNLTAPVERRKVQFVVLSPQPSGRPHQSEAAPPTLLMEIDPTSPGWWERTKAMTTSTIPGLHRGPTGNCRPTIRRAASGVYTELPPSNRVEQAEGSRDLAWQAYPLAVAQPGRPHILEIEYPSDVAQSLGVSLIEPNAVGAVTPIGVDSGVFLDDADVEPTGRKLTRRIVVWPQTATPLVVVMNRRRDVPAVFGKLRLLGPRGASLVPLPWGARDPASLPHAHLPEVRADGRLLAAYYDRPLFAENFSSGPTLDSAAGDSARCLDDWVTFYEGARRLVEYLTHAGYNGAMITVAADGSTIYPSKHFDATPRYDDGVFFAEGQDPTRKDVLELLHRMFDREGLRLVPAVQFASRLPRLEAVRRETLRASADDPLRPHRAAPRTMELAKSPYDPLKLRVQQEMLEVVAELRERYGTHASFSGVAVQLSPDGFTQHLGADWGADAETLRRFANETNLTLAPNLSARDLAVKVVDDHRVEWLAWRAQKLAELYGKMSATITGDARRSLYLVAAHAWESRDAQTRLQPNLSSAPTPEQALLESGLDPVRLGKLPGVIWMRPYASLPVDSLVDQGPTLEMNRSEALDRMTAEQASPASLVYFEPQSARLESFEKQSPFQPTTARLFTHALPGAGKQRRMLAHQLAALDSTAVFQGGWLLPLGEEDDLRKFAGVVRSLPAEKFSTVPSGRSFVTIRTLTRDDRTYYYVVNDAPWATTVTLEMSASPGCVWRGFGSGAAQTGWVTTSGTRKWQAKLEPYDVVGGFFLETNVKATEPQIDVDPVVAQRLAERIRDLWNHAANIQRAAAEVRIFNAGFGQAKGNSVPKSSIAGWRYVAGDGELKIETTRPHAGGESGLFTGGDAGGAIVSEPIQVGPSGRVALSVWLRKKTNEQPRLRLAFEGRLVGAEGAQPFYRFASVGGGPNAAPLDDEWRQFLFQVHDLPTTGLTDLRIRFELSGPGEVVLDDVAVTDLDFTDSERLELSKAITLAEFKLQRGEIGECARILDGYWPRFLQTYVPIPQVDAANIAGTRERAPAANAPTTEVPLTARNPTSPAPPLAEQSPGIRDRMKRFVPDWLR